MPPRPSAPLLDMLRKVSRERGLNTAALAQKVGMARSHLKHVLSGSKDLTVDEFIGIAQALELSQAELTGIPETTGEEDEEEAPTLQDATEIGGRAVIDPYGNHAEQVLKMGFELGIDLFMTLETAMLEGSGVPADVIRRFPESLPVRLDAAFHRHHDPRFHPEGITLQMSLDALYTCTFRWAAIKQITLFPLPPDDPPEEEEEADEDDAPARGGHLRLVT